jgi:formamidopyrimidine-DNA glycosylase
VPEGPEVETVRRTLHPQVLGRLVSKVWVSSKKLRTPVRSASFRRLLGRPITGTGRHGKLLWLDMAGAGGVLIRLGMTGRVLIQPSTSPRPPHTHVVMTFDEGADELRYVDPRRFGEVVPFSSDDELGEVRANMGPDPLAWTAEERRRVLTSLRSTQRTLKDALLDQRLLSGVGNIYASEALFVARISPTTRGCDASSPALRRLLQAVEHVLTQAVVHRGTTFADFVDASGGEGQNLAHLQVFWREGEPCTRCQRPVERMVQGARSTFYCRACQR